MTEFPSEAYTALFGLVAAGEPPELRSGYLARPPSGNEVRGDGTAVPLLATVMVPRPSGLLIPRQTKGQRLASQSVRYMTAQELIGQPLAPAVMNAFVFGHRREDLLLACAILMAELYDTGPLTPTTQEKLASGLVGRARRVADALFAEGGWMFMAPQAVLNVAKLALLGEATPERNPDEAVNDAIIASLGMATFLTAGPREEQGPLWWGTVPEALATEVLRNQLFNRSIELGSELARWQRSRQLAAQVYSLDAAEFDQTFQDATGTTPDVLFDVGFAALLKLRHDHQVALPRAVFDQLRYPPEQVDAALDLLVADPDDLADLVVEEVGRVGFAWSFNALRRFPMFRTSDGRLVVLNPAFLVERVCGSAYFWELRQELNRRRIMKGARGRAGRKAAGRFEDFIGHVPEEYAAERMSTGSTADGTLGKRMWREQELRAFWPAGRCCDLLLDAGSSWVAIEIVSHRMSEDAAEAGLLAALDKDLRYIVDEKAEQLDATISRLIDAGGRLPGMPGREEPPRYHPLIVAASGFPWNQIMAPAVWGRLRERGLLQHAAIRPLTVVTLPDVEHLESFTERGLGWLGDVLDNRFEDDESDTPMDWYLHHRGGLMRPMSLMAPMMSAFEQTGAALGFDASVLDPDGGDA